MFPVLSTFAIVRLHFASKSIKAKSPSNFVDALLLPGRSASEGVVGIFLNVVGPSHPTSPDSVVPKSLSICYLRPFDFVFLQTVVSGVLVFEFRQ